MITKKEISNLVSAWGLRDLPSFEQFWEELPNLFNWLND